MRRFLATAALALLALLAAPAAGHAADGEQIAAFADDIVRSWVPHQDATGTFVDPILGSGSKYGTAMLGYGLLRAGVRRRDPELIAAGIRAINSRARTRSSVRSYFQVLPFAKAYVFARRELADDPFWRASRAGWESYLRTFARGPTDNQAGACIANPGCYHNHEAVQTAAEVALLKTGLRSRSPGSPLRRRERLEQRVLREVNEVVPRFIGSGGALTGRSRFSAIGLLSDTGTWPLAYHGLSTAMYALSLQGLPARKTQRGRSALRRATRASLGLMAPDGDVSWLGRRQQEAWALASEIAVGMTGAQVAQVAPGEQVALRTMAHTGLRRLQSRHPISSSGLANTPRSSRDPANDFPRGIQADPINSNGLVVFLLNLAADRAGAYSTSSIPMDHAARLTVRDQGDFAAVRRGNVWYAVRDLRETTDLRYAFGLAALKVRSGDGWQDLIEPRPVGSDAVASDGSTTVGPVIVRDGRRYRPSGARFTPQALGVTTAVTSFRAGDSRFTEPVTYTPTGDGILVELRARAGDTVEFTSFHPTPELQLFADGVGDSAARISVSSLAGISRRDGFASCCEPALTALTLQVAPDAAGSVRYRVVQSAAGLAP